MASRRASGFTLIELMVIIVILGILLGYAIPNVTYSMTERRIIGLTQDLVRLIREAHDLALTSKGSSAYMVHVNPSAGLGRIQVLSAVGTRCTREPWLARQALCPAPGVAPTSASNQACPTQIDLNVAPWTTETMKPRIGIALAANSERDLPGLLNGGTSQPLSLCFESTGEEWWAVGPVTNTMNFNQTGNVGGINLGGAFVFTAGVFNSNENRVVSLPRVAVVPYGGMPRRLR